MNSIDLTHGSVVKQLLRFTIPLILTGILQLLYTLCDSLIVGNLVNSQALAAINSSTSITNIFLFLVNGLVTGCTIQVAHLTGSGHKKTVVELTCLLTAILFVITVFLSGICLFSATAFLELLHTPDDIFVEARQYFQVIAYGFPFLAVYNLTGAVARGLGDSKSPFYVLLISSILNIALDLLFVAVFPFGITGAAVATVSAQLLSAFLMSGLLLRRFRSAEFAKTKLRLFTAENRVLLWECLRLSIPNILRGGIGSLGSLSLVHVRNLLGSAVVQGISGAYNIDGFLMLPFQYVGDAFSVFAGTNLAAGKPDRVHKGVRQMIFCLIAYEIPMLTLLIFSARVLLSGFGLDSEGIRIGYRFLCTAAMFYPVCGIMQLLLGYLNARKRMVTSSVISVSALGVRVGLSYLLLELLQADVIAWAEILSWIYAMLILIFLYHKDRKTLQQ